MPFLDASALENDPEGVAFLRMVLGERTVGNLEQGEGGTSDPRPSELKELTPPQFITWLGEKMTEHGAGKVIPPEPVIAAEAEARLADKVRAIVTERVLREACLDEQVAAGLNGLELPSAADLLEHVENWLGDHDADSWTEAVEDVAENVVASLKA